MTNQEKHKQILENLKEIIDPDLGKDIVTLGFVKGLDIDDDGSVQFSVELTTPACPLKASFKKLSEEAVQRLPWVKSVNVTMTARAARHSARPASKGLANVAHVIAVSSCKGGVGKSTIAVNLAYALAKTNAKVGLLDADIYGPSLPTMISMEDTALESSGDMIRPLEHEGVKLMSFGYASRSADRAAIMRGPMVSGVINQLAGGTDWGELDYLVVDMPPGTGDIQLTLTQQIPLSGALIVTTPQKLSFVDVVKGMQMFETVKVPILGVVENMSYFECGDCKSKHYPFGQGAKQELKVQYGIGNTFEIPMHESLSAQSDRGNPLLLSSPDGDFSNIYRKIAGDMVREISRLEHDAITRYEVSFDRSRGLMLDSSHNDSTILDARHVRLNCRCAHCIDEFTGEKRLGDGEVPADVEPVMIEPRGNYAVAIAWSDGHSSSIYPYEALLSLA